MLKQKVLIVEDDKEFCDFLVETLLTENYEPLIAHTGEEGMSMVLSHCPDLVLLDIGLPDMDGLEILTAVRTWSTMPVLVISGRLGEREKIRALDKGADDYLTKPCSPGELLARMRVALRHTRTASRDIELANEGKLTIGRMKIDYNNFHFVLFF